MKKTAGEAIDIVARAQRPDGYLDTYYILTGLENRWTNTKDNHEMYCAGHMLEAAVAYYQATGKRKLLDVMTACVAHIASVIGPEEGKLHTYPGHEVLEMALCKLYEVTRDERHLRLARYFIDERGASPSYFVAGGRAQRTSLSGRIRPLTCGTTRRTVRCASRRARRGHAVRGGISTPAWRTWRA